MKMFIGLEGSKEQDWILVLWTRKSKRSQAKQFLIKTVLAKILREITFFLKVKVVAEWVKLLVENNSIDLKRTFKAFL
jgi:hypothetical protein